MSYECRPKWHHWFYGTFVVRGKRRVKKMKKESFLAQIFLFEEMILKWCFYYNAHSFVDTSKCDYYSKRFKYECRPEYAESERLKRHKAHRIFLSFFIHIYFGQQLPHLSSPWKCANTQMHMEKDIHRCSSNPSHFNRLRCHPKRRGKRKKIHTHTDRTKRSRKRKTEKKTLVQK